MNEDEHYKHLSFLQSTLIGHSEVKEQTTTKYKSRLMIILKTGLNAKNKTSNKYICNSSTYILIWVNQME
jgi:hypothetical protein